ncbi:OmpA family protein [Shewanella algidipiscicola]|uniref:Sodium-type flagellar protein MotY n=1 Tax=Shewanella algidipiscicola TaxID=614070 RepID=A0ABQ4P1Z1_9GAMM|nr:OmpA family protein [Shewanella algidipiscicola]GIU41458.1 sodium-type flagellar protein MotY [Shewanella algidipiscicola]
MRGFVSFSLFLLLVLSAPVALSNPNVTVYKTPLEKAQWLYQGDRFGCELRHPVTGFGAMALVAQPGQPIRLTLNADWLALDSLEITASIEPSTWQSQTSILARTTLQGQGKSAVSTSSADLFLEALESNYAWQILLAEQGESLYRIDSSAVSTQAGARQMSQCIGNLLPQPFSYVRQRELLFAKGSDSLTAAQLADIQAIAAYVKADKQINQILVDGHADSNGDRLANLMLSRQRSDEVVARLIELGISRAMIQVRSHGTRYPKSSNTTEVGRQANRRVSIRLVKQTSK